MDLGWLSLAALLIVIVVSCTSTVNPGVLSVVLAWLIAVYLAPRLGTPLTMANVIGGFPTDLFLTLVGVTLLFTQAQLNGTLDLVAHGAVHGCRGNVGLIAVMFFFLTCVFSSIGAGNIAATALMAPMAMVVAGKAGIPAFLMTILVVHGALAGAMSPIAPTGLIANNLMNKMGMPGREWLTFGHNFLANLAVASGGFLLFGGWRLFGRVYVSAQANGYKLKASDGREPAVENSESPAVPTAGSRPPLASEELDDEVEIIRPEAEFTSAVQPRHLVTLALIAVIVVLVVGGNLLKINIHVGMAAFTGSVLLTLYGAFTGLPTEGDAIKKLPWGVILMVCGVTVLTALLEKTGGADRFERIMASLSTEQTAPGVVALLTGLISVYSSTSGVVLPAFLPMVPGLIEKLGGGNPVALASSMIVGGHLVDSSPLSTLGALCIASAPASEDRRKLFNQVMAWGLSMAVVGAVICYVFFGLLNR
ncbi:MAG: C4-dicarboxylate ABC transporter [Planctomycetia bacterium]|nr:C4-dicarboxylate ABC transporter [Planctomycetia bacterium]